MAGLNKSDPSLSGDRPRPPAVHLFKDHEEDKKAPEKEASGKTHSGDRGDILCASCGHAVTSWSLRTARNGSHEHTFANPHGHVFTIGCFSGAPGCGLAGPATAEFSWFPGHTWKVAVCGRCLAHLGWYFSGRGQDFFGLIRDALSG